MSSRHQQSSKRPTVGGVASVFCDEAGFTGKPRTLVLWAREGKVPAHRLSGVRRCIWRFLRSELDAILGVSSAVSAEKEAAC